MMNFLNLEYFLTAAEELNFTKAAKKLFISQQSLSSHISKLENDLGVELFNRTVPLTLTPAGKSLVKNAVKNFGFERAVSKRIGRY
ncbi:DNA-binding transcriptional LysR family regulator [Clostridium beijerinckii]|uniref:LysR family transcriptional regulator n=1 Tax=Clostridium beijerinckii TaxID=1520 RepID=UPI00181330B2|nr:DNA-binding transcriptional LysR family regulator [Clostridium beijerinckii]